MTTVINAKLGTAKGGVARIWLEGQKLIHAGLRIGAQYVLKGDSTSKRVELVAVEQGAELGKGKGIFTVSKRERNGVVSPLLEVRSELLSAFFEGCEKVRVAIRAGRILITARQIDVKIRERVERLKRKLAARERLAGGSLFHGIGVLDKALHKGLLAAGVAAFVQVGVELEGEYLDASLRNNPEIWSEGSVAINSDIRDVYLGGAVPQLDLVCGGVPCTGASVSGRAKNKLVHAEDHSTAGTLFFDYLEFVKATNPAVVLLENVVPYANTAGMSVVRSVLGSLGYNLFETTLSGPQFGAIEDRHRLVMVAVSKGISADEFVFPNTHPSVVPGEVNTLADVLDDIPLDSPRWKSYDYLVEKEERDIAAGKGFRRQLVTGGSTTVGTIGRGYARCRSTEPFVVHPQNPQLSRLLTPAEHARVKGIPETMGHGLSDTTAHEGYGQAVIFNKFEAVGVAIGSYLRGLPMPSSYYVPKTMVADVGGGSAGAESVVKGEPVQAELLVA